MPTVQLYPNGIKAGVSEECSIIVTSYSKPISVESVRGSIDFSKSSFGIVRWESREHAKAIWILLHKRCSVVVRLSQCIKLFGQVTNLLSICIAMPALSR